MRFMLRKCHRSAVIEGDRAKRQARMWSRETETKATEVVSFVPPPGGGGCAEKVRYNFLSPFFCSLALSPNLHVHHTHTPTGQLSQSTR